MVEKPLLYYRNNLVSLINLLELMPKHGVEGIVFSSSCTVYGQPDELPVTEKAPIKKAESPYGNTKQINEEIIRDTIASGAPINAILLLISIRLAHILQHCWVNFRTVFLKT